MKKITPNRRTSLINAIQEYLEDNQDISEWSQGFLESIQEQLIQGKDLKGNQYPKLLEYIEI